MAQTSTREPLAAIAWAAASVNGTFSSTFTSGDCKQLQVIAGITVVPTTLAISLDVSLDSGATWLVAAAGLNANLTAAGSIVLRAGENLPYNMNQVVTLAGSQQAYSTSALTPTSDYVYRLGFFAGLGTVTGRVEVYAW